MSLLHPIVSSSSSLSPRSSRHGSLVSLRTDGNQLIDPPPDHHDILYRLCYPSSLNDIADSNDDDQDESNIELDRVYYDPDTKESSAYV